uniref:RNA-directed RNA polymerase n=1 Tax=Grapevine-associated tombus-like virus 4 TaxID=2814344 RepID=A0A8F5RB84_9TOMB|nr:MAG: RNA-dependent RNA polymerase [Grapevine-associated tombus-like virus 4]
MYRCFVPRVEGVWAPAVHSNCMHNEVAALGLRTMGPTPEDPISEGVFDKHVEEEFKKLRLMMKRLGIRRKSREEIVAGYSGALRRRYQEASESLDDEELGNQDYKLRAFLKGEKFNPLLKVSKPRMICPRSPRYNLELARYLKPLEHALWKKWKVGHNCPKTRVSGKGLNGRERASLIKEKMDSVGDCLVFEVDGKAFEAHVSREQLLLEHSVYKAAYPGCVDLQNLLQCQLTLKGKTAAGIKFERDGCRASGDFNTGLGNTMLMGSFVIAAMNKAGYGFKWTVLADGDNCLLFVERRYASGVVERFAELVRSVCSHEMTVEKPTTILEGVVFGQSRPCATEAGYTMVRDPYKVLSGAFCGYRHFHEKQFAPRLIRGIALAELSLARGLPVLGAYFQTAAHLTRRFKALRNPEFFLEGHLINVVDPGPLNVTAEARTSFALAWGIGVEEQLALEQSLTDLLSAELLPTLQRAAWLDDVVEVVHGRGALNGDNPA